VQDALHSLSAWLLGRVSLAAAEALSESLIEDLAFAPEPRGAILLCEHEPMIAIGQVGSRGDIAIDRHDLAAHGLSLRYVNRSGGTILHGPGQLACHAILPMQRLGLTPEETLRRLTLAVRTALDPFRPQWVEPGERGSETRKDAIPSWRLLLGRTGPLAAVGIGASDGFSHYGAFVNVNPPLRLYRKVQTFAWTGDAEKTTLSSLMTECGRRVTMSKVRSSLVEQAPAAFGASAVHVHSHHPRLAALEAQFASPSASPADPQAFRRAV